MDLLLYKVRDIALGLSMLIWMFNLVELFVIREAVALVMGFIDESSPIYKSSI